MRFLRSVLIVVLLYVVVSCTSLCSMEVDSSPDIKRESYRVPLQLTVNLSELVVLCREQGNRISALEKRIPAYLKEYDENRAALSNSQHALAQSNQIIDSLINYQSAVNELLPYVKKVIVANAQLMDDTEFSRFVRIYDNIIEAEANCKKKTYGD